MFGVVEIRKIYCEQDPKLVSLTACSSLDEALTCTNRLLDEFLEEYGEDYCKRPTKEKPMAMATNGDVDLWAYIREFEVDQ